MLILTLKTSLLKIGALEPSLRVSFEARGSPAGVLLVRGDLLFQSVLLVDLVLISVFDHDFLTIPPRLSGIFNEVVITLHFISELGLH